VLAAALALVGELGAAGGPEKYLPGRLIRKRQRTRALRAGIFRLESTVEKLLAFIAARRSRSLRRCCLERDTGEG